MFPNMPERLQAELQGLVPEATKVKVIAPPERMISVWIGGSILASLSTFSRMWINRTSDPDANPPVVGYDEPRRYAVTHESVIHESSVPFDNFFLQQRRNLYGDGNSKIGDPLFVTTTIIFGFTVVALMYYNFVWSLKK